MERTRISSIMFKIIVYTLVVAFGLGVFCSSAPKADESIVPGSTRDYVIGPGDVLNIYVWKNEELTKTVPVLPDGKITFPLLGEFMAGGKTVAELKSDLSQNLKDYVKDPIITVIIQQIGSLHLYVIGRVNNPGRFVLNTNINVLQGLALAGGLNPFAKKEKIKIFREEGTGTRLFGFNYEEVAKGEKLSQNIMLKRGDVIVVP